MSWKKMMIIALLALAIYLVLVSFHGGANLRVSADG